jgi:signal peptidase I
LIGWQPVLTGKPPTGGGLPAFRRHHPADPASQLRREVPLLLILAIVIAFMVKTFGAQLFYIPSASMQPQLNPGDRVVVSKVSYDLHSIHRGDVVVFEAPVPKSPDRSNIVVKVLRGVLQAVGVAQPSTEDYIKRVIALPGETVETRNGEVWINGKPLQEPYLSARAVANPGVAMPVPVKVPPGQLWVMGDNRGFSQDSRYFGPIRQSKVVGRAIVRIWPFGRTSFL